MVWRSARALMTLRDQIDGLAPERNKSWDGTRASVDHHRANPNSDHEPWVIDRGTSVVTALDITHDPEGGVNSYKLADLLLQKKDPRIKYVISNSRIASGTDQNRAAWVWRKYSGRNKHDHHVHVSVKAIKKLYDSTAPWDLDNFMVKPKPVSAVALPPVPDDARLRMGKLILDYEARRDKYGRLAVYPLPAGDGGGVYEVAGINDRYHPKEAAELAALIRAGKQAEAERRAIEFMAEYTDVVAGSDTRAAIQFFLRDTCFNRGPRAAACILQRAVNVDDDGTVGPITRTAAEQMSVDDLLMALRVAREEYEREVVGYRAKFWKGLVNRWNKAEADARTFIV